MTWGNPPKFKSDPPKRGKKITPEMLAGVSEDSQQMALFAWAALNTDKYPALEFMFAIPNGGSRHIAEATKFVGTGTRSGVPDIFLPCDGYRKATDAYYYGCFLEMKVGKNQPTKEQLMWIAYLKSAGYHCAVCYSWTAARDVLIDYLEGRL